MTVERFTTNPLITPETGETVKNNINGPSLIKVPDFVKNPLGRYYLYFAHHQGDHIRLAYADRMEGPYTLHKPGVLPLGKTPFSHHIASPDVHVDHENKKIFMIYHGWGFDKTPNTTEYNQISCYADSPDGLAFSSPGDFLAPSYLRIFFHKGWWYGCDGGPFRQWRRARHPGGPYEAGGVLDMPEEDYPPGNGTYDDLELRRMRHLAFDTSRLEDSRLDIYYSNVGDAPERIKRVTVDISKDWKEWHGRALTEALSSKGTLEGEDHPVSPSENGAVHQPVHQLRDPYIFTEGKSSCLIYSHAGEAGLSGVRLISDRGKKG